MEDDAPPLAYHLIEGVVGCGLVLLVLTLALLGFLDASRTWAAALAATTSTWKGAAELWGAVLGLAPGLGLAYGVGVHTRGRPKAWLALTLAPVALLGAVYGAEWLAAGLAPWRVVGQVAPWLGRQRFWSASLQCAAAMACVGVPLVGLYGKGLARQSRAAVAGGLCALALTLPVPDTGGQSAYFADYALIVRGNFALIVWILGPALLPLGLFAGRIVATRALTWLGQPTPLPRWRWRPPPRPWIPRLRAAWFEPTRPRLRRVLRRAWADVRAWAPPACAWVALAAVLAGGANGRWWPWHRPVTLHALDLGALALLVGGWIRGWPWLRSRQRGWLGVAALAAAWAAATCHGPLGPGALLSALAVAGLAIGAFPLYAWAILLVALPTGWWWPFLPLVWLSDRVPDAVQAGAAVVMLALILSRRGWRSAPWIVGMVVGASGATYLTMAWIPASTSELVWWLLARDVALVTGLLGALIGGWVGTRPALRGLGVVAAFVAVGASVQALAGDPFEHRTTRALRRAAEAGDAEAMLGLARDRELGMNPITSERDGQEALRWYQRAAEAGHPEAMYELALRLADGRAPVDHAEARRWFARALESGCRRAREREAGPNDPLGGTR